MEQAQIVNMISIIISRFHENLMYIQQNEGRKYTHTQIVSSSKKECSEMESPNELDKSLMITTQRTKKWLCIALNLIETLPIKPLFKMALILLYGICEYTPSISRAVE